MKREDNRILLSAKLHVDEGLVVNIGLSTIFQARITMTTILRGEIQ